MMDKPNKLPIHANFMLKVAKFVVEQIRRVEIGCFLRTLWLKFDKCLVQLALKLRRLEIGCFLATLALKVSQILIELPNKA